MIKNIVFDMGGVLIDLDMQASVKSFKNLGFENVEEYISPYTQSGFMLDFERGLMSNADFCNEVRKLSGKTVSDKQIEDAWFQFLLDIPIEKLKLIKNLREKYMIYLLSNTNWIHFPVMLERYNLDKYFDKFYLSCEVHYAKPDPRIFEYMLNDAGIKAEETLFIDDGPANIKTAESLGFQTHLAKANESLEFLNAII